MGEVCGYDDRWIGGVSYQTERTSSDEVELAHTDDGIACTASGETCSAASAAGTDLPPSYNASRLNPSSVSLRREAQGVFA